MNKKLKAVVKSLRPETISDERKAVLQQVVDYVQPKAENNETANLNFICIHNSRRSHLSQIWAQTMAHYLDVNVNCYSGGTVTTAMFPMVAETLKETGFDIEIIAQGNNPVYSIKFDENAYPVIGFSKVYNDAFNPKYNFMAVMVCSQADTECPFIPNAEKRFPVTYDDPKAFDNTPQQAEKYRERSLQIATEMFYVFSKVSETRNR